MLAGLMLLGGCESCLKRSEVESVDVHPYPTCGNAEGDELESEVLHEGILRSGPISREQVVERYTIERRKCLYVITVRQEWARQVTDVEAVFDDEWNPIRVWKRMGIPGVPNPEQYEDTRLYEFRNEPATMTERNAEGRTHRFFRGGQPTALVGPGRALLTAWIRATALQVGETSRADVLDIREIYERVDEIAIRRDPDRFEESLDRNVRVYTIFGRESVFADDTGLVIGDLSGLRRDEDLEGTAPPSVPSPTPPDPRNTP